MKKVREPNMALDEDYSWPLGRIKTTFLILVLISFAFIINFPSKKIADHYLSLALQANPRCQLQFNQYQFGFFLPSINFENVAIPNGCLSPTQKAFRLDKLSMSFRGLNFSPMGVVAGVNLKLGPQTISAKISTDGSSHIIKIDKQTVMLSHLSNFLQSELGMVSPTLKGKANLDANIQLSPRQLELFELKLSSTDLIIPSQTITGFSIPELNLNTLQLSLGGKGNKVLLKTLQLGQTGGDLFLTTSGSINANFNNFAFSQIDLSTEFELGDKIANLFGPLLGVLEPFKKGAGYKLKLTGNLMGPIPSPL